MNSSAEEGLMALLEAMLTLAAREARRPKPPPVKPGGYPEEHFLDLTEDEKDEFSCSICYQILKETMQCVNSHKFCHSCLLVWSTTGQYANRIRCPVCRTHGYYYRNNEIDDRIGLKKVKCLMESCTWSGLLKYLCSHRHNTYEDGSASGQEEGSSVSAMPRLAQASQRIPSTARFMGTGLTTSTTNGSGLVATPRAPLLSQRSVSRASPSSLSSTSQETIIELPRRAGVTNNTNSTSTSRPPPRRVPGVRGNSNNRITFSHTGPNTDTNNNVESGHTSAASVQSSASTVSNSTDNVPNTIGGGHMPRPPSAPRTSSNVVNTRRLPRIINPPSRRTQARHNQEAVASSLNPGGRARPSENLGEIRERLQDSRNRLDNLMTSFSGELDRSRQEMADFQQERERQRREQLEEVRELGQRLGQVASELRRLLEQRRHISTFSDDDDDDDDDE